MTFPSDPTLRPGQLGPASSGVVQRVLDSGAARVTNINETTRQGIQALVSEGVRQGMSPAELGDVIERWSGWDEYRAELIARTELGTAYNEASVASYQEQGVEMVHVTDGDEDDECAPWADVTVPIDEAPDALGHPNCTRDFEPVVTWTAEDYATAQEEFGTTAEFPTDVAQEALAAGETALPEPAAMAPVETAAEAAPETPNAVASALVERASAAEPKVTADLVEIGRTTGLNPNASFTLDGKELHTLEARLKTLESTTRKIEGELKANPDLTLAQVERSMKDNLRYTYVGDANPGVYESSVQSAVRDLVDRGYEPVRATNYWAKDGGYAGLNTNWRTPDGQIFEVQFHTQESLVTKEVRGHPLYERERVLTVGSPEWQQVQDEAQAMWRSFRDSMPLPGRMQWLGDYFPEVR